MNIQWDAKGYVNDFSFVHQYGADVLGLIDLADKKSVLDLGCGNGALTKKLSDLGLEAIGMDASLELLEIARNTYPELVFYAGDATQFELPEPVDIVFSNAVLHWIDQSKQKALLHCVYEALKEGGQFVFEFGGKGNNALIHTQLAQAFARRGLTYQMPFYFPSIGEYAQVLEQTGFHVVYAVLFDRMTPLKGEDGLADWIRMFVKTPFTGVAEAEQATIIAEVVSNLKEELWQDGTWYADYVRIRCKAIK